MNVLSDLLIMAIPIPLLVKLQVPLHRKVILTVMFSSGVFIMVCTVLRAYYSLKSLSTLSIALNWANRECFVAAIVVSLPGIKPLFRNSRWIGTGYYRRYGYKGSSSRYGYSGGGGTTGPSITGGSKNGARTKTLVAYDHRDNGHRSHGDDVDDEDGFELAHVHDNRPASSASKEAIINHAAQNHQRSRSTPSTSPPPSPPPPLAIRVTTEYTLHTDENRT